MQRRASATPHADASVCGATKKRGGGACQHPAGFRTDHAGQGRCWLHGGATPTKHGRYSLIQRPRLAQLLTALADDTRPLDTLPEIALVRALLVDYIERYDAYTEALIAWHESYRAGAEPLAADQVLALRRVLDEYEAAGDHGDELTETQTEGLRRARDCVDRLERGGDAGGKPHQVLDVAEAYHMAADVTKMVERVERAHAANAVTLPDLERLLFEMKRAVQLHVPDPAVVQRIEEAWLALRV